MSVDEAAPDFFALWEQASTPPPRREQPAGPPPTQDNATAYAKAALERECRNVAQAAPGTINATLNIAAYNLGQLVGAGHLDYHQTAEALHQAAVAAYRGNIAGEGVPATIASGLKAGQANPRAVPPGYAGTEPPPVTVLPDDDELDAFWSARPELTHLHQFARARMCSPWAVLGCALVRVVTATPPYLALPAIVGSHASLNLFVALVGPSGTGKGAAEAAAADAIDVGHLEHAHVGSGEGIGHLYAHRERGQVVRDREAVLFTIPEVDNLTALGSRQGSTLLPQLRMAWSGERLGFAYVDKTKTLPIDRHTYRLGLVLGVQPGRAAPLLEDADGGTPQRFLWMPTTDPDAPEAPPEEPAPLPWSLPAEPRIGNVLGLSVIGVPAGARREVVANRRARLRGDGDGLDGHALLARLKVAAAFALLDRRTDINDEDWALSATLMQVSDACRGAVRGHLASRAKTANAARGEAEADRAVVVAERVEAAQVKRVCRVILRALRRDDKEWVTARDIRLKVAGRDRGALDDALGQLLDVGQVETREEGGKTLYRVADRDLS